MLKGTQTRKESVNKFVNDKEIRVNRLFYSLQNAMCHLLLKTEKTF